MPEDLLEKGREALAKGEWQAARTTLSEAVRTQPSPEALEELAWACWWMNDIPAVFDVRTRAYQAFIDKDDKRGASRTASWLGLDCLELSGEFAVASGWFKRAESLLEGDQQCQEYVIINTLKANLVFRAERNADRALELIEESLALSKSLGMVEGQMLSEGLKGFILVTEGRVSEGMQLLDEATVMALSETSGDIRSITTTCCFLIDACNRIRDYERADQWCVRVKEICKRWNHRAVFATCRTQYAAVLIWRGDWKEAEEELANAIEELKTFRPAGVHGALVRLADLRRRQGRWSDAVEILDTIKSHWLRPLIAAELAYDRGFYEESLQHTERFLRQIPTHEKTERVTGIELLIRLHVQLKNLKDAEVALTELKHIASSIGTPPLQAAQFCAEGVVAHAKGNFDNARQLLEHAIELYEQLACPFESSRAMLSLSRVLSQLDQQDQSASEIETAMRQFERLGAEKEFARAKSMLKNLEMPDAVSEDFTSREMAVLKLIAQGKNNQEIAEKLFLSVRTVEKHITNIYLKLGVTGKSARAFAASYASTKLAST